MGLGCPAPGPSCSPARSYCPSPSSSCRRLSPPEGFPQILQLGRCWPPSRESQQGSRGSAKIQRLVTQALRKLSPPNPRALLGPPLHPLPEDQSPAIHTHQSTRHLYTGADSHLRGEGRGLWAPSSPFLVDPFLAGPPVQVPGGAGSTMSLGRRGQVHAPPPSSRCHGV